MVDLDLHRRGWSRRAVLGGAVASAGLALIPFARRPRHLFVSAGVSPTFAQTLRAALATATATPIELVRVSSVLEVPSLLDSSGGELYSFASPAVERELERGLDGRRLTRLSFGTRLERERAEGPVRHAHLALTGAFEQAGAWAAERLGKRAAIVATGLESTTDLAFAFRHGFEARGGQVVQTQVAHSLEPVQLANADVTLVLASGPKAPAIWNGLRGRSGQLLTHPFALGAHEGTRVISTWTGTSALEALARRAVDPSAPLETHLLETGSRESTRLSPTTAGSAHLAIENWAMKSGASFPYTGC